jgi:hypothetical protein
MTSTSAAVTGIGSPRLSRTTGSPPDKAGAPGAGLIDGFGAVTALACDDRRREGGPRQLGGSVLLPISLPAQGSASVVWSPCLAPRTMTRAGCHGVGQVGTPHSGGDHPEPLTTRRVGTPCSAQRAKATRRADTTRVAAVGALARSIRPRLDTLAVLLSPLHVTVGAASDASTATGDREHVSGMAWTGATATADRWLRRTRRTASLSKAGR